MHSGIAEFDRVLGGGIVRGALTLIGGEPGVGKSTLLSQVAGKLAAGGGKTLYVSGEESATQIKLRAERLGVTGGDLLLLQRDRRDADHVHHPVGAARLRHH